MERTFIQKYKEQALKNLKLIHPNKTEKELSLVVNKAVEEWKKKEREKEYSVGWMFEDESVEVCEIEDILDYLEEKNRIIAGSGCLYLQHGEGQKNILAMMVDMLLSTRKIYKKAKFKAKEEGDKEKTIFNDLMQLTYKILANSFYGASTEPNCIFFDNFFGLSITLTGRIIITTSIFAFESFSGNFYFETMDDFVLYVRNIIDEDINIEYDFEIENKVTKDQLLMKMIEKFETNPYDIEMMKNIIYNLDDKQIQRVYYKNNYVEFMKLPFMLEKYSKIAGHIFMDPNDPEDKKNKEHEPYTEFHKNIDEIWSYLRQWVLYNHINIHRYQFAMEHNRKTVLVVDTDSNFLYNKPITNTLREMFPDKYKDYDTNNKKRLSTINLSMYFYTRLIADVYDMMGRRLNINDEEKRKLINMKNEYLYKRLEITPNKKWYSGLIEMQEGVINDPPELDIKGIPLRKVSLNKKVRLYFTDTLKNKILNSDKIDYASVYQDFVDMENIIRNSLNEGKIEYAMPDKVKEFSAYKAPMTIASVKGSLLWNALYPDEGIQIPDTCMGVKLKPMTPDEFIEKLPDDLKDNIRQMYRNFSSKIQEDKKVFAEYDVQYICFPRNTRQLPEFLIPLIDTETMVKDAIKPILIIINSLGFSNLEITQENYSSNIIEI